MRKELKIISLSEIKTEEVKWLWYPYIPFGKVTIVQGDPGEGKTTFVLSVIAALTCGEALPECETGLPPMNVIYQTAEDGLSDTIKPRLEAVGADCTCVQTIDDSNSMLTLTDQRLEEAIHSTDAGLLVLDPLQAYLGSGVDMHRANEIRPIMKKLSAVAERTGCAVVLIGHMNKASGEELSEYIFTNEHGKLIHPDTFSKTLRKIYDSIGLPHEFHLHTLRHYYVTTLLHSGVDKQTVADLVGHCDTSFLERTYCHPRLDKKRSAAEAFAAVQFGESIRSRP